MKKKDSSKVFVAVSGIIVALLAIPVAYLQLRTELVKSKVAESELNSQTPAARPSSIATDTSAYYDDFNDKTYDRYFNPNLWAYYTEPVNTVFQQDGQLHLSSGSRGYDETHADTAVMAKSTSRYLTDRPLIVEADLELSIADPANIRSNLAFLYIGFLVTNDSGNTVYIICRLLGNTDGVWPMCGVNDVLTETVGGGLYPDVMAYSDQIRIRMEVNLANSEALFYAIGESGYMTAGLPEFVTADNTEITFLIGIYADKPTNDLFWGYVDNVQIENIGQ